MPRLRKRRSRPTTVNANMVQQIRDLLRGEVDVHPELWARWGTIAGPAIASRALPYSLRRRVLTVSVASSAWLHELSFLKSMLLGRIAEEIGPTKVRDVRFVLDPTVFPRRFDATPKPIKPRTEPLPDELEAALGTVDNPDLAAALLGAMRATLPDTSRP